MTKTFKVKNFKGARQIELSPTGSLVLIAGANGAGKSSFIDAITELFDPHGVKLTPKPIHEGEDEARAEYIDTDLDVRVVRTWRKNDAGKLEVFALDGAKYGRPAEIVAELTGGLIFDPVAFLNLDEKKQRDALLAKVDLPIDLDALARQKAGAEDRRADAGREVRRLQGALDSMPKPPAELPTEKVSATDILDEIREADTHNRSVERARLNVSAIENQIRDLEAELAAARAALDEAAETSLADLIDTEPMRARLRDVEGINDAVRAAAEYHELEAQLARANGDHAAAQTELDDIDTRKRAALAEAVFPVDGLSVDDEGITFNGIPFSQTNSAARRSVAFAVATAGNPKLRLVIVKDGDLLDATSLEAIEAMADERGYTVLMERDRDQSRSIGFTIVDGELQDAAR